MSIKQRNPQNVKTITDAVVYISYADDPKVSKNGVLDHTWMTLGILKDDQEIDLNRAMEIQETKGLGMGTVAVTGKPGSVILKVLVLEENDAVQSVLWPDRTKGSTPSKRIDGAEILLHSAVLARPFVAVEYEFNDGSHRILASRTRTAAKGENLSKGQEASGTEIEINVLPDTFKAVFEKLDFVPDEKQEIIDLERFTATLPQAKKLVKLPAGATGGTWNLRINYNETKDLAHDANADKVKEALREIAGGEEATVSGSATAGFTVEAFEGILAAVSHLEGATGQITVEDAP
nr:MAG TPA: major tail protein [Caudoviricetes sp.]